MTGQKRDKKAGLRKRRDITMEQKASVLVEFDSSGATAAARKFGIDRRHVYKIRDQRKKIQDAMALYPEYNKRKRFRKAIPFPYTISGESLPSLPQVHFNTLFSNIVHRPAVLSGTLWYKIIYWQHSCILHHVTRPVTEVTLIYSPYNKLPDAQQLCTSIAMAKLMTMMEIFCVQIIAHYIQLKCIRSVNMWFWSM